MPRYRFDLGDPDDAGADSRPTRRRPRRPVHRSTDAPTTRAIATRTRYGKALIAGQWAATEFEMLSRLWSAGVAVPYPVQLRDTEVLLEFLRRDCTNLPRWFAARGLDDLEASELAAEVLAAGT